jgi:hypothetical protein
LNGHSAGQSFLSLRLRRCLLSAEHRKDHLASYIIDSLTDFMISQCRAALTNML